MWDHRRNWPEGHDSPCTRVGSLPRNLQVLNRCRCTRSRPGAARTQVARAESTPCNGMQTDSCRRTDSPARRACTGNRSASPGPCKRTGFRTGSRSGVGDSPRLRSSRHRQPSLRCRQYHGAHRRIVAAPALIRRRPRKPKGTPLPPRGCGTTRSRSVASLDRLRQTRLHSTPLLGCRGAPVEGSESSACSKLNAVRRHEAITLTHEDALP
jgi:hypothetical protein